MCENEALERGAVGWVAEDGEQRAGAALLHDDWSEHDVECAACEGGFGYVRNVGTFLQDQIIYAVYFTEVDRTVGCREEELISAQEPWAR